MTNTKYIFAFGADKIAFNQMEAEMLYFVENRFRFFAVQDGMLYFYDAKMDAYFSNKDIEEIMPNFGRKYLESSYFEKYLSELQDSAIKAKEFYQKIWNKDFSKESNEDLASLYRELYNHLGMLFGFLNSTGREVLQPIEKILTDEISKLKENNLDLLSLLTKPDEIDDIKEERLAWYQLLLTTKMNPTDENILRHALEFCWMFPDELSTNTAVNFFKERMAQENINEDTVKKQIAEINTKHRIFLEQKHALLVDKSEALQTASSILSKLTYARMQVKIFYGVNFVAHTFINEIAKRIGELPTNIIYQYSLEDVQHSLSLSQALSSSELQARQEAKLLLIESGKLINLYGKEAQNKASELLKTQESIQEITEFKASIANKGFIRGRVKIVPMSDIESLKMSSIAFTDGDILVTTMTQPNMVPLAKRASAIITDQGGITCHAAIISRELGKPCLIGAQIATKVLKDGDMVEVDANNGIVRILK